MDLTKMTLAQLKEVAKEKGMKGVSTLKKQELMERRKGLDAQIAELQSQYESIECSPGQRGAPSRGYRRCGSAGFFRESPFGRSSRESSG